MTYSYEKAVHVDEDRDVVWSRVVDATGEPMIAVEMSREFLADRLQVAWRDKSEVRTAFEYERGRYLESAIAAARAGEPVLKVYSKG